MKKLFLLVSFIFSYSWANAQYCASGATSTADEEIWNISIGSLNNTTNCANPFIGTAGTGTGLANRYSDFTSIAPTFLFPGQTYTFSVTIGACGTFNFISGFKIYMDFNQDQDFIDPGEEVYWSGTTGVNSVPASINTGTLTIPITAVPGLTRMRIVDWEGGQNTGVITPCGTFGWGETEDYLINIIPPVPCSGMPFAGNINQPDTVKVCPTTPVQLCVPNSSAVGSLLYNWLKSTNGGATWDTIAGATSVCYTVPAGTPSALYAFKVLCLNSFDMDTTDNFVYILNSAPSYASLPYTQSFENWINYCSQNDVPDDGFWLNSPATGDDSWRRQNQGGTANWTFPTNGNYTPPSSHLNNSARFHSYYANTFGSLDLFINLSSVTGTKLLNFDYKLNTNGPILQVEFSTNGGNTFTTLGAFSAISNWSTQALSLASDSPNCVIRFKGFQNNFTTDIGLDNVMVLPPCTGAPTAGIMQDTSVCKNDSFIIKTIGSSLAASLSYTWQSSASNTGPWATIGVTNVNAFTTSIVNPTYFRCIITCTNSAQASTSSVMFADTNDFYFCYCKNAAISNFDYFDVGCVQLLKPNSTGIFDTLIYNLPLSPVDTYNNSNAINGYQTYQSSLPIRKIYRDSLYVFNVTDITQNSWNPFGSTKVMIDYNRNGFFEFDETIGGNSIGSDNSVGFQFIVPDTALPGITGLRVITTDITPYASINNCGTLFSGEVEDYLVEVTLPPCKAPTNPGIAYITDSLMCPGYVTIVYDTNHTDISQYLNMTMIWQKSTNNGVTWSDIAGATTDSLIDVPTTNTRYRLKLTCGTPGQGDTVYSNEKIVNMIPSFACYPASGSFGGSNDTADNGYFTIGNYSFSSGSSTGPHVGNPAAIRFRTDFSPAGPILLYTDSTYDVSFYNILRPYNHADARITMFIDYNNNGLYDIPAERIYTGISSTTSFYLPMSFKTASSAALDVNTGMRVVLNNNIAPNPQSDLGVGLYVSGETEDFLVKFRAKPNAIKDIINVSNIDVYPNPSNGIFNLQLTANDIKELNITVLNMVGSELYKTTYKKVNGNFNTTLDLSELPKGNYTLKLQTEKGTTIRKVSIQ
jgi:hypothetical protein